MTDISRLGRANRTVGAAREPLTGAETGPGPRAARARGATRQVRAEACGVAA